MTGMNAERIKREELSLAQGFIKTKIDPKTEAGQIKIQEIEASVAQAKR